MKYKDVVKFEAINTVVQLRNADDPLFARNLVGDFIISKSMEENLNKLIFPHLQFDYFNDNKALMVIGNYGTGKSHMLSVISAIAEDADNVSFLNNENIKKEAVQIAGKFKVIRMETGGVQTPLETIILRNTLEKYLSKWKVRYQFPDSNTISTFKDGFIEMMEAFSKKYPDQGVLIVIDELLEFLKGKNHQELNRDLGFFRQFAEVCKDTRIRVVVGMQESIFDSPEFVLVGGLIQKIKDRTEIVSIKKEDIRFVVSERLLKKEATQKAQIRSHLEKFKPYYENLTSNFDNFVDLFPLHPSYLDTFAKMVRIEKRQVLKSVSNELNKILDKDIPTDVLDLVTIDSYWKTVENDASLNAYDGIKEVKDINVTLHDKVNATLKPLYKALANRIVDALCLQRLESTDVNVPIGLTAKELKDNLFLFDKNISMLGGDEVEQDLLSFVEETLTQIIKAVNGQFIERTPEGQYFINVHKTFDYDQTINTKIEQLSDDDVNNYYYVVMKNLLECPQEATKIANKLWNYELQFLDHKMYRKGWLFFGIPSERSTAVPEQDFYLFFIPPKGNVKVAENNKADEVVIRFNSTDEAFDAKLKEFAALNLLELSSSQTYKTVYQQRKQKVLNFIGIWMKDHLLDAFKITYDGKTKTLANWIGTKSLRELSGKKENEVLDFKVKFDLVAALCLRQNFSTVAPNYPIFETRFTNANLSNAITETLRSISTNAVRYSTISESILKGLGLITNGYLHPRNSLYANWILNQLDSKDNGVVLNNSEILESIHDGFECMKEYRLERPFVSVLLLSLIASGDIVLTLRNKKYDASNIRDIPTSNVYEISEFSNISKPSDWNMGVLCALLRLFGLQEGLANSLRNGEVDVLKTILSKNEEIVQRLAEDIYKVQNGLFFMGRKINSENSGIEDHEDFITEIKDQLETIKNYNNLGKLKNFNKPVDELNLLAENIKKEIQIMKFYQFADEMRNEHSWLENAKSCLNPDNPWIKQYEERKQFAIELIQKWDDKQFDNIKSSINYLKQAYIVEYKQLHDKARLSLEDGDKVKSIYQSKTYKHLSQLSKLDLFNSNPTFGTICFGLGEIKTCSGSKDKDLLRTPPLCSCGYSPAKEGQFDASFKLSQLEEQLERLLDGWIISIVDSFNDPSIQQSIKLMSIDEQQIMNAFKESAQLPEIVTDAFIATINKAQKGLVKKTVSKDYVCEQLLNTGKPVTLEELRNNFQKLINELSKGESSDKIRIVLE